MLENSKASESVMRPITQISIYGIRLAIVVLSLYWVLIFAGTHLPRLPKSIPLFNDKLIHFGAYFVLVLLMCYSTTSPRLVRRFSVIAATAMLYGAIDELTQMLVPNRRCDLGDYLADLAGIYSAIVLYVGAKILFHRLDWQPLGRFGSNSGM